MKSPQNRAKQLVKGLVDRAVRKEMREWPPVCFGPISYQPKRPATPQRETGEAAK